ncbi:hypothetical protein KZ813_05870 [Sphingomonas sp. RHCKR7]|uniref:hypothetical protein n=1 Tax=Sphingomonas folli TaxID=2862497 RepID=UPI001CA53A68|nr:hypothetical protein [Sphingomonas folli]MBW6526361.1 hypothetical protein [Sphingomonas folli]
MLRVASAIFDTQADAHHAVSDLRGAGVRDSEMSVVTRRGAVDDPVGSRAAGAEDRGAVLRAILGGGAFGAGLGVATLALPGVGPLVAAGAIAASAVPGAMALGAVAGATAGTLAELLAPHGLGAEEAAYYDRHLSRGGVLLWVGSGAAVPATTIADIMYRNGGHDTRRPGNSVLE